MKKLKKAILGAIVLIMALNIIACDNKPKEEKKVVEQLKGKITIWVSKEDEAALQCSANLFLKKNPKVKIDIITKMGSDVEKNLTEDVKAKVKLPDIITLNDYSVPKFISKHQSELLDVSAISGFNKDSFITQQINNASVKNKIYALPWYVNPTVVVYRQDLLKSLSLSADDIKTWDQYSDIGKDKLVPSGKGMLSLSSLKNGELYNAGLAQLGINYLNENGKIDLLNKTSIKPASTFYNMYQSKVFYDDSKDGGELEAFAKGNIASLICNINTLNTIEKKYPLLKGNLTVEKLPAFEEGGNRNAVSYGTNLIASKVAVNNKAAVDFMKFLTMDEGAASDEFDTYGYIVSNSKIWENEFYYKENAFYGNQILGKIVIDEIQNLRDVQYSGDFESVKGTMLNCLVDSSINNKSLNDNILNLQKLYENTSNQK